MEALFSWLLKRFIYLYFLFFLHLPLACAWACKHGASCLRVKVVFFRKRQCPRGGSHVKQALYQDVRYKLPNREIVKAEGMWAESWAQVVTLTNQGRQYGGSENACEVRPTPLTEDLSGRIRRAPAHQCWTHCIACGALLDCRSFRAFQEVWFFDDSSRFGAQIPMHCNSDAFVTWGFIFISL